MDQRDAGATIYPSAASTFTSADGHVALTATAGWFAAAKTGADARCFGWRTAANFT